MDPVPCLGLSLAVVGSAGDGGDRGLGPGLRLGEPEFRTVLGRPAADTWRSGWFRQSHHPIGSDPADQLDRQVAQNPGQAGDVVASIADNHDRRVPDLPLASGDEPFNDPSELGGGDRGRVVCRAEPDRVQDRGPGRGARLQRGHERVGPVGDELRGGLRPAVDMAEQALCRARCIRAKPRRHVDCQDQASAVETRQRQAGQHRPQPTGVDPAVVQAAVHRSVPTPMLGQQCQVHRGLHRAVRAQHRVRQFEQLIAPGGKTLVELAPEA